MKVLHVIASVDPEGGGPIEGVVRATQASRLVGYERHVVTLDPPDDPCVSACPVQVVALGIPGQHKYRWRNRIPWTRYRYSPHLKPWLRRHAADYDAVIVNGLWNYAGLGTWRALAGGKTPYFVYTHGMLDPWFKTAYPRKHWVKQAFWWCLERRLVRDAKAVFFTTEEERVLARNAFWPYDAREEVVSYGTADAPHGTDAHVAAFRAKVPGLGERKFLLFLSRIHPKKGCDLLIRAFGQVAKRYPDIDLVMAGPDQIGMQAKLAKLAGDTGVGDRIFWPGMLSGEAKWGAFRACEAFVLPSHSENFGIVVSEALACGKPVLITDKVNIWREVSDSDAGLVCSDTEAGVRQTIEHFLDLPHEQRLAMGRNARQCFVANFEIGRVAERFLQVLTAHLKVA